MIAVIIILINKMTDATTVIKNGMMMLAMKLAIMMMAEAATITIIIKVEL